MAKKFSIVLEDDSIIQEKINVALAKEVNKKLPTIASNIEKQLKPIIRSALLSSPEINSLSSGSLRYEFGLTSDPTIDIVDAVSSTVRVNFSKVNKNLSGGLTVTVQPTDFLNLLSLPYSCQYLLQ